MRYNEHKCDAILTFNNQQLSLSLWRERGVLVGMRISMYQTRDSVNNALYVKAILEHFPS